MTDMVYVVQKNEEINLYGIDGSKPGAASAGVWLSHRVIGLHEDGKPTILFSFQANIIMTKETKALKCLAMSGVRLSFIFISFKLNTTSTQK
jgi:hypothetical protein